MEPTVTTDDLEEKWGEVRSAVRDTVQQQLHGVSYLTVGLLALSVGALGTAYYLGRRSAVPPVPVEETVAARPELPANPPPQAATPQGRNVLGPVVGHAVSSAVTTLTERLKSKLTCEPRP